MQAPVSKPVEAVVKGKKTRHRTRGRRLPVAEDSRQRRHGGGRKRTTDTDLTLKSAKELKSRTKKYNR